MLLVEAGQEAGHIFEDDERNIEAITKAHEAGRLFAGGDIEDAG